MPATLTARRGRSAGRSTSITPSPRPPSRGPTARRGAGGRRTRGDGGAARRPPPHPPRGPAPAEPGLYRTVTGAEAISIGLVAGAQLAGLKMFFGGSPITPPSAVLHPPSRPKEF